MFFFLNRIYLYVKEIMKINKDGSVINLSELDLKNI